MSYTLRGRIESRLTALLPVLVGAWVATALTHRWWPLELAALMAVVGVALDIPVYDRLLAYQPGWYALPLGLVELGVLVLLVRVVGIGAPLWPAVLLFGAGWLVAQALAHAGFPVFSLSYAEDGGELGVAGALAIAAVAVTLLGGAALAWVRLPPTVHLAAGVHQGPLVISSRQVLQGEPGAIVQGGIVVRANDVTIRDVTVVGGENGIAAADVDGLRLERVSISGAALDGIHVRGSSVAIRNCSIDSIGSEYGQGIDISYGAHKSPSSVTGCTVVGGQEGIVTHFTTATIARNRVSRTTLRAISMTEMSMGMIEHNEVRDALGIGILCNDSSMCHIEHNLVVGTRPDEASGNLWRLGFGVLASYNSEAMLKANVLDGNPHPMRAVLDSTLAAES